MQRKDRRHKTENQNTNYGYVQGCFDPFPTPFLALFKEKSCQGNYSDHVNNGYGPALDRSSGKRGEDEQGEKGIARYGRQ